ncbi:MAG: ATP-binding protein [Gammaproteobacteria bacterium]
MLFLKLSRDFSKPAEIFWEAIANALDAYARNIWLRVKVVSRRGRETVIIDLCDDGIGMARENMESFLSLSDSDKPDAPPPGMTKRRMTGYKGHGTKVYYNSDELEILTYADGQSPIYCRVSDPMGHLAEGRSPTAEIESVTLEELRRRREEWDFKNLALRPGTTIRVIGYHHNSKKGLEHTLLGDYICWFTRWASWEPRLRQLSGTTSDEVTEFQQCSLYLRGLGKETDPDKVPLAHRSPHSPSTASPPRVEWITTTILVKKGRPSPGETLTQNRVGGVQLISEPRHGDYLSEERYGLWLCRDYVPIQRFNNWVSERSEYTRMHAFVNCDALSLTANRGSVENTPQELLEDIERTVRGLFAERVEKDDDYTRFLDEMLAVERHRHASKEAADYKRRLKRLESKQYVKINGVEFLSPHTEIDLVALVSGVQALIPEIVPFVVRDFDSHFGFDGLATRKLQSGKFKTRGMQISLPSFATSLLLKH